MAKAQTRASNKYQAKAYDKISIFVPKGKRELIKAYAENNNMSVNALVCNYLKTIIPELNDD